MGAVGGIDWSDVDVAAAPLGQLPGVRMAGFGHDSRASIRIAMVPHPAVTVLMDLTDHATVYHAGAAARRGSVVVGLSPGTVQAEANGPGEVLEIRLSPLIAAAILGDSEVIADAVTPLADLWGRDSEDLSDRLRALPSWSERFALVSRTLADRAVLGLHAAPEVAHVWTQAARHRGRVRVEALAAETGWSRQRLWSRFRAQIGLSPKRAAELIRFDHAARLLSAGRSPADVAVRAGYSDQSHLHRQIRIFTQATPGSLAVAPWLAIDDIAWPTPRRALAEKGQT